MASSLIADLVAFNCAIIFSRPAPPFDRNSIMPSRTLAGHFWCDRQGRRLIFCVLNEVGEYFEIVQKIAANFLAIGFEQFQQFALAAARLIL